MIKPIAVVLLWVMAMRFENTGTLFQGSEMSPGLFQEFMVFVSGVTQGNEDTSLPQNFILLFYCKLFCHIERLVKHPRWSSSAKIVNDLNTYTSFA